MSEFRVKAITQLHAEFSVPGDKSMSHRAAILGGLSNGVCTIRNFLPSEDCVNTLNAMQALGARHEVLDELPGYGPVNLRIHGQSMKLTAPAAPIDCGNAGTGMRLLAGLLAGQDFSTELFGDASLSSRPMGRVTVPLGQMGANIETLGRKTRLRSPAHPRRQAQPDHLRHAGRQRPGEKRGASRRHVRRGHHHRHPTGGNPRPHRADARLLQGAAPAARATRFPSTAGKSRKPAISPCRATFPARRSGWSPPPRFPDRYLLIKDVGLNPTRTAILKVLSRMGAHMSEIVHNSHGEPIGNIKIQGAPLTGTTILIDEVPNLIDEIPVIAVAAALAQGRTIIRNAKELRVKETDRITTVVNGLRAMGAEVEEFEDGMEITGGKPLHGADHRKLRRPPHRHGLRHRRPFRGRRDRDSKHRLREHLLSRIRPPPRRHPPRALGTPPISHCPPSPAHACATSHRDPSQPIPNGSPSPSTVPPPREKARSPAKSPSASDWSWSTPAPCIAPSPGRSSRKASIPRTPPPSSPCLIASTSTAGKSA